MKEMVFRALAAGIVIAEVVAVFMWAQDDFQPRSLDMLGALAGMLLITPPAVLYMFRGPKRANELLGRLM